MTTRYTLSSARRRPSKKDAEGAPAAPSDKPPRGALELRTFDPVSGAALRYRTTKAAEVSRLVQMLGALAKRMAAVPVEEGDEDVPMRDAPEATTAAAGGSGTQTPVPAGGQQQQGGGGGGKGKKKKGKR